MANCNTGDRFDPWVGKMPGRRKWQPTPVSLPGESHGHRSLVGYSPRGRKESDMTERPTLSLSHLSMSTGVLPLNLTLGCREEPLAWQFSVTPSFALNTPHWLSASGSTVPSPHAPEHLEMSSIYISTLHRFRHMSKQLLNPPAGPVVCAILSQGPFLFFCLTLVKSCLMRVREESEKAGLKLNTKKLRSWHPVPSLHGKHDEEVLIVTDFLFLGSKITVNGDFSHEIKRCLLPGRKAMTNLDSTLKSRESLCQERTI